MLTQDIVETKLGIPQEILHGGAGAPLVWLHGEKRAQPGDALLDRLSVDYRVIAPIFPGFNNLEDVAPLEDIHDVALYYDSLFDQLGLGAVTLVGHSFGGMVAAEVAAHVPARVAKLVLVSPLGLWNDAYPIVDLIARPYPQIEALFWAGAVSPRPPNETASGETLSPKDQVEALVAQVSGLTTMCKFTWPIPDRGLDRRLYRVAAPTHLIFARDDALVPAAYIDDFAAKLPGARKTVVPGCHMLPEENPGEVADLIRSPGRHELRAAG